MKADANAYKKSSFGPAFLFLNKKQRQALAVYYAFCRLMDDIADEPDVPDPQAQLFFWREEIARVYAGNPQTPLGRALTRVVKDFDIPSDRFLLLIKGMEADLQGRRYGQRCGRSRRRCPTHSPPRWSDPGPWRQREPAIPQRSAHNLPEA